MILQPPIAISALVWKSPYIVPFLPESLCSLYSLSQSRGWGLPGSCSIKAKFDILWEPKGYGLLHHPFTGTIDRVRYSAQGSKVTSLQETQGPFLQPMDSIL